MQLKFALTAFLGSLVFILALRACKGDPADNGQKFNYNYMIDLKQNGYVLQDEYGQTHHVEFGKLEEFFEEDNL